MQKSPVTITEFINISTNLLKEKNIRDARLNSELMLCEVLKCDRMRLYLDFEKPLSGEEIKIFRDYLKRRLRHEPLQYIFGKSSFYGLDFIVNEKVLIPRQETELLVEKVINDILTSEKVIVSIFEIGTGSGCISISIAKVLKEKNIDYVIFSIDNSAEAINVAVQNLEAIIPGEKKVRFYKKDIFEIDKLNRSFDYIISNPPYISYIEFKTLDSEVKDFEPENALTDMKDGLRFYEKIFEIASDENFKGKVYCEIGFGQSDKIEELSIKAGLKNIFFYNDYSGIKRILEVRK